MGELNKWIPVSPSRFTNVIATMEGVRVAATVVPTETLRVGFVKPDGTSVQVECTAGEYQTTLTISSSGTCL